MIHIWRADLSGNKVFKRIWHGSKLGTNMPTMRRLPETLLYMLHVDLDRVLEDTETLPLQGPSHVGHALLQGLQLCRVPGDDSADTVPVTVTL